MYRGKFERTAPERRRGGLGGIFFYTGYFACLLAMWAGIYSGLGWLRDWLVDYQAAQPDSVCAAVFDELFDNPDWGRLYDLAGQEGTPWEGKEAYVRVMEERFTGGTLTLQETSAGLSGDRKYLVQLEGRTVAAFTLTEDVAGEGRWKLGKVSLFAEGVNSYTVTAPEDAQVLVNGRALPQEQLISISASSAGEFLPVGIQPEETCTYRIDGLLTQPQVQVLSADGQELPVSFEKAAGAYTARAEAQTIGEAERDVALKAARTYALFMIKRAGAGELAKYFNPSSDTYREITSAVLAFVQEEARREFTDESVTDYCRYSESLFSVRVQLNLKLYRSDGSVKDNPIDRFLFFSRESGGKWLCYAMTAVDVSRQSTRVRLTFCQEDRVLLSEFFPEDSRELRCPIPEVPEGKTFSGWMIEQTGPGGENTLRLVFCPSPDGTVTLPADTRLTPMTLYPLFE